MLIMLKALNNLTVLMREAGGGMLWMSEVLEETGYLQPQLHRRLVPLSSFGENPNF